jgi:hypothetical protein
MGANNGDGVTGTPLAADGKGDDGRSVAGEVVLAAGSESRGPRVTLADEGEARLFETSRGGSDSVVSCKAMLAGAC